MNKIPARKKAKKASVAVREKTAQALGMTVEAAEIRVNAILQRHKIKPQAFLSVLLEKGKPIICTSSVNIECDSNMITSIVRSNGSAGRVSAYRNAHPPSSARMSA
jgi:hypothetical protein